MRWMILGVLLTVGCSGAGGPCKERKGTYVMAFTERSGGTCGQMPEQVVTYGMAGGATAADTQASCTGANSESADHCTVTLDVKCSGVLMRGEVDWSPDGSTGTGIVTVSGGCLSTYDVTARKR